MNNKTIMSVLAASALLLSMCSCTETEAPSASSAAESSSVQTVMTTQAHEKSEYSDGNYSGDGFTMFADPVLWQFIGSDSDTAYDLKMITDRDFVTLGLSVYTDANENGKTAQEIVMSADNKAILSTGALSTAKLSFYYYEWAVDEETRARNYFADLDGRYLCVYAESTNFGFVDSKIADLLSGITLTEKQQ